MAPKQAMHPEETMPWMQKQSSNFNNTFSSQLVDQNKPIYPQQQQFGFS
jgi:hypothetical protein